MDDRGDYAAGGVGHDGHPTAYVRLVERTAVVVLSGEHDLASAELIEDALAMARNRVGSDGLVVGDLSTCAFIDSSAMRPLYAAARAAAEGAARFALVLPAEPSSIVRRAAEMGGLASAVPSYTSVDCAVAGVGVEDT